MIDPSNKVYKWTNEEAKLTTYIVPVYIGIVIKGVSNIIIHDGKIDYNYTLVVRISKCGLNDLANKRICKGL